MSIETLLVLFEGLLVFGGALAFGIWQLRSIKRDQEKTRQRKEREQERSGQASPGHNDRP